MEEGWGAGGAACVRGLPRGAASRPFPAAALLRALEDLDRRSATVFVDVDAAGFLVLAGRGGRGGGGGAELCVRLALAPHVQARGAALCVAAAPSPSPGAPSPGALMLRLELTGARAPHDPLLLWPDERAARLLRLPHLAPHHILGAAVYRCDACEARFDEPNPLKVHLFLGCAPPEPGRFWARLAALPAPAEAPSPTRLEALPAPAGAPSPAGPLSPARLEALAAAWGRARGGPGAHACLYCGKAYSRAYGLKIHIRTHTGHRPLRCPRCARAFADPSNLNKHVRLHARPPLHAT